MIQMDQKTLKKILHGGILELDENDKGLLYKIKISEHIKNVIRKDSTNIKLGLVVSSDISSSVITETEDSNTLNQYPTHLLLTHLELY